MDESATKITTESTTKTIATTIKPLFGDEFQLLMTLPNQQPIKFNKNTIPITIHISKSGTETPLGCFVYSVIDLRSKDRKKDPQIYQSLLNNSQETLVDLTRRLGQLVSKRYHAPSYVSLSGDVTMENFLLYIKEVFKVIDNSFSVSE